jgi:hypothetical protein
MKDARLSSVAALAARSAHAAALAAGASAGSAFERAWAAYTEAAPGASMWESQAIVAEAIGMWRRDRVRAD